SFASLSTPGFPGLTRQTSSSETVGHTDKRCGDKIALIGPQTDRSQLLRSLQQQLGLAYCQRNSTRTKSELLEPRYRPRSELGAEAEGIQCRLAFRVLCHANF